MGKICKASGLVFANGALEFLITRPGRSSVQARSECEN
jgi:hypothetical protein